MDNLDCAPDKASTWTVAKRKAIKKQFTVTISRKRATSLSDSPSVANMQKDTEHINPDISTKNRYSVFADSVINNIDSGHQQNHKMTSQTRTPQ